MHWRTKVPETVDSLRPPGQARPQAEVEEELSMVSPEFLSRHLPRGPVACYVARKSGRGVLCGPV
jgi:hypothetical protein